MQDNIGVALQTFMPQKELREAYSNCTVHPAVCPSVVHIMCPCISPIFFEVGIPNLACKCI